MLQLSQVLSLDRTQPPPQARDIVEVAVHQTLQVGVILLRRVVETVSCLVGRCPRAEPRTAWAAKPLFDRREECVEDRAKPSAMSKSKPSYTTRRSEAKPR
jgi:hypothetical protein